MPKQGDLSGVVEPGRGLGATLMADSVVMQKLEELSGFPIVPGTLNVRLPRPLKRDRNWRYLTAAEITPDWEARTGQSGYFLAPVTVAGRYRGLAFQAVEPGERGYSPDQIELFCEAHLRTALGLGDGDPIAVVRIELRLTVSGLFPRWSGADSQPGRGGSARGCLSRLC